MAVNIYKLIKPSGKEQIFEMWKLTNFVKFPIELIDSCRWMNRLTPWRYASIYKLDDNHNWQPVFNWPVRKLFEKE